MNRVLIKLPIKWKRWETLSTNSNSQERPCQGRPHKIIHYFALYYGTPILSQLATDEEEVLFYVHPLNYIPTQTHPLSVPPSPFFSHHPSPFIAQFLATLVLPICRVYLRLRTKIKHYYIHTHTTMQS